MEQGIMMVKATRKDYRIVVKLTRSDGAIKYMRVTGFGPYHSEKTALVGLKRAAKFHGTEYTTDIVKEDLFMELKTHGIIDKLNEVKDEAYADNDVQVVYLKVKRLLEQFGVSDDIISASTESVVYKDEMAVDIQTSVESGDLMNAKYKMQNVNDFNALWYYVDGYDNYRDLTKYDVVDVIDEVIVNLQ